MAWHTVKESLRRHACRGDKMIPFLLKFRDIVERISHHVMLERLAATSEVLWLEHDGVASLLTHARPLSCLGGGRACAEAWRGSCHSGLGLGGEESRCEGSLERVSFPAHVGAICCECWYGGHQEAAAMPKEPRVCTWEFLAVFELATHLRAVLKPQSSVLIIADRGEVKVVKSCARARSAQVRPKGRARLQF